MTRAAPLAMVAILLPAGLAGQGISVTPFAAADRGLPGAPGLVGVAATAWTGPVGVRLGGAMDLPSSPLAALFPQPATDGVQAWQGDLDLIFDLGRVGLRIRSVEPRMFAGVGAHGRRQTDGSAASIAVWSYGGGAALPLTRWLALDFETRYRMPHETDLTALPAGVGGGWETRGGLAFRFGGARGPVGHPATPRRAPAAGRTGPMGSPAGTIHMGSAPARGASAGAIASSAIRTAERYVGVPYVWGGNSPSEGFDCSGFVRYVFAEQGIRLPRVARDQAGAGTWLPPRLDVLAPGDLMFYAGRDGVVDHVAIYAGNGRIIHATATGRSVRYDDLDSARGHYYATRMVAARRVIPDGGVFLAPR